MNKKSKDKVSKGLAMAIESCGGTQIGLAKKLGVSKQAVNAWVRKGRIPNDLDTLKKVSIATGIPVYLLADFANE